MITRPRADGIAIGRHKAVLEELEVGDGRGAEIEEVIARAAVPRCSSLTPARVGLAVFDGDAFEELRTTCRCRGIPFRRRC